MASALTMWDFSWAGRRSPPHDEYADWDQVLDELVERGYDCVRIDAFPHLVAAGSDRSTPERFKVLPEPYARQWGTRVPVELEPRKCLIEFIGKARDRDLSVALSTWFNPDESHRRDQVRTPQDYIRVWQETLELLESKNLLSVISWVDLCNEFPLGAWAHGAYREIFGVRPANQLPAILPWRRAAAVRAASYWREAIPVLKQRFPSLRFTCSTMGLVGRQVLALEPGEFDLLEAHVWLTDDIRFAVPTLGALSLIQAPGSIAMHSRIAPHVLRHARDYWSRRLYQRQRRLADWAKTRSMPLYTTEGWATVNYTDQPDRAGEEWDWVKELCAEAVHNAVELGWAGICTSNFAQPHFPGMWNDVEWHRQLTDAIHRGPNSG